MYEKKHHKLITVKEFQKRLLKNSLISLLILMFSLLIGVLGYHFLAHLSFIDSIYNSSMILAGMGPVAELTNGSAKLFASFYAIYSGVAFLTTIAVLIAPIVHRIMHKFHLKED